MLHFVNDLWIHKVKLAIIFPQQGSPRSRFHPAAPRLQREDGPDHPRWSCFGRVVTAFLPPSLTSSSPDVKPICSSSLSQILGWHNLFTVVLQQSTESGAADGRHALGVGGALLESSEGADKEEASRCANQTPSLSFDWTPKESEPQASGVKRWPVIASGHFDWRQNDFSAFSCPVLQSQSGLPQTHYDLQVWWSL